MAGLALNTDRRRKFLETMNNICEDATPLIMQKVIEFAKNGDMRAADLVMRRSLPERKGAIVDIQLPDITKPTDIINALNLVTVGVSEGRVTTDEALALCTLFEFHRKAFETCDLDARVKRMEEMNPAFNPVEPEEGDDAET